MALENLKVWVSPLTNRIYAGYLSKDGFIARSKVDVTQQVLNSMMEYMYKEKKTLVSSVGELKFIHKKVETEE